MLKGARKSGDIVLNGPAARKFATGDIINYHNFCNARI